ncbi:MAG: adenylosuccinate synthase [Thermoplasmataceae archaeon]
MRNIVLGLMFGDEGKGKVIDFLTDEKTTVIRFNGGTNAGHTVVTSRGKFKFHLLPSGALRASDVVLGNGMVIDPFALKEELDIYKLENANLRIMISKAAGVVTPIHVFIDKKQEQLRGDLKIGTTSKGIGPCYEDKFSRNGIRMGDLVDKQTIMAKLKLITTMRQQLLEGSDYLSTQALEKLAEDLYKVGKFIEPLMCNTELFLEKKKSEGNLLFEGGHGALLDIDFGVYPYVTSSNTMSGGSMTGSGFSLRKINNIIGVTKSYISKVGEGPFPTEISGSTADSIREAGGEYGTTTGRPRRIGWLDIPLLKYSIMLNDVDVLAMTMLDVIGKQKSILICESYRENFDSPVQAMIDRKSATPEYIEMASWGEIPEPEVDEMILKGYYGLPQEMKDFITKVESLTGREIGIISIGQRRERTIIREKWKSILK